MQSIEILRKRWDEHFSLLPFHSAVEINDEGLVFGAGTVLARMTRDRFGEPVLAVDADEERFLALLLAVYGRPVPREIIKYVARASDQWRRGDKCLAHIELAFARLPRLESREDGYRLFLAEALLEETFSPRRLMRELGVDPNTNAFRKGYDPNEPRVLAGNGDVSGQWTKGNNGSGNSGTKQGADGETRGKTTGPRPVRLAFLQAPAAAETAAALIAALGVATFFAGTIFIPKRSEERVQGTLVGAPDLAYLYVPALKALTIERTNPDWTRSVFGADIGPDDGIYDSRTQKRVGTQVWNGLALDHDAVVQALDGDDARARARSEGPKLCPRPEKDRTPPDDEFARLYQEYVGFKVNQELKPPLSADLAYFLHNPVTGKEVSFDHCQLSTKIMIDAKGHYESMLRFQRGRDELAEEWIKQATRQIEAAKGNGMLGPQWHFYEKETMEFARKVFEKARILDQIQLVHTPYPGNDEWPYPPSAKWAKGKQKK